MKIHLRFLFISIFFWISDVSGQSVVSLIAKADSTLTGQEIPVDIGIIDGSKPDSIAIFLVHYESFSNNTISTNSNNLRKSDFEISDYGRFTGNLNTIYLGNFNSGNKNEIKIKIWDEGKFILVPLINDQEEINYDSISTGKYSIIYVKPSVDPNDSIKALAPIKDIVREKKKPADYLAWYHILLISIIIAALLVFLFLKYRKKSEKKIFIEKPIEPELPYIVALKKLKDLENEKIWLKGQVKEFHEQLTFILREYLEKKYKFNALEQSTSEIICSIEKTVEDKNHSGTITDVLQIADLIKFAKARIDEDLNRKFLNKTIDLINILQ